MSNSTKALRPRVHLSSPRLTEVGTLGLLCASLRCIQILSAFQRKEDALVSGRLKSGAFAPNFLFFSPVVSCDDSVTSHASRRHVQEKFHTDLQPMRFSCTGLQDVLVYRACGEGDVCGL